MGKQVKDFCKVVSQACRDGLMSRQQAKTLIGQAKHGDMDGAMRGLTTVVGR